MILIAEILYAILLVNFDCFTQKLLSQYINIKISDHNFILVLIIYVVQCVVGSYTYLLRSLSQFYNDIVILIVYNRLPILQGSVT